MSLYHNVAQGECFSSIARKFGFVDYRILYDHPQNAKLKAHRPDPNILFPGDRVFIPDKTKREEFCSSDSRHRFVAPRRVTFLELVIKLHDAPLANADYVLSVDGQDKKGTTDSEGLLRQEIDVTAKSARLAVPGLNVEWELQFGQLDPIGTLSGVQARLNNLGIPAGPVDGKMGSRTRAALRQYEVLRRLPITEDLGAKVLEKLRREHDSGKG